MALRVVTAPTRALLTLADAKQQLRVDYEDDDLLITALIAAAGDQIDDLTMRRYASQTLEWVLNGWSSQMVLPIAPLGGFGNIAVTSISYVDLSGAEQVLDPSQYWARPYRQTLAIVPRWFVIWPWLGDGAERVVIEIAIDVDEIALPPAVTHAARLLVSHWYANRDAVVGVDNRDSSGPLPFGVEQLLSAQRWSA
jgi:uncharacterized phiE125 gp8 family phage protein